MAHSYKSEYPIGVSVNPEIVAFFEEFYRKSDIPGAHDEYVDQFTKNATLVLGSKRAAGSDEIMAVRQGMWTAVASRKHTVYKVFPFGDDSSAFMLYGTVSFGLKAGGGADVEWAGRAEVEKSPSDGKWRMKFYQVYMDSAAVTAKK